MWKLVFVLTLSLLPVQPTSIIAMSTPSLVEEIPPYAKWSRIAIQATKEKYPNIAIVDYLHIGREITNEKATEKFKLWLRGQEKEFGVFIDVQFNLETEEVIEITFEETNR